MRGNGVIISEYFAVAGRQISWLLFKQLLIKRCEHNVIDILVIRSIKQYTYITFICTLRTTTTENNIELICIVFDTMIPTRISSMFTFKKYYPFQ